MRNPFGVLGLEASADADQVRAAYRKLVKTCHPDKFQDETERKAAQEKMITLNLAYEEAMKLAVNRTTASAAFNRELDQQDALTLAAKMLRQDNPEAALRQLLRASTRDSAMAPPSKPIAAPASAATTVPGRIFICGEPMNSATKRQLGRE